ncbi:MAG: hypothetical protein ACP5N3_06300 [Candidatus Nanoarchaeia archaeon]
MKNKLEFGTKLTTQSFSEAGGSAEFPDLDIGSIVTSHIRKSVNYTSDVAELNELLDKVAHENNCPAVFGIKYDILPDFPYYRTATGTGYVRKHNIKK